MRKSIIGAISRKKVYLLWAEIIMSVIMSVSVILGTGMIAGLIDEFIEYGCAGFEEVLPPILVCMVVATVAAYCKKCLVGQYSILVTQELNECAVSKLVRLKQTFFEKEGSGKIITKLISDMGELEKYFESTLPDLVNNIISIGLVMVYVGLQNVTLLVLSLCIYPVVLVITYFLGKRLKVLANNRRGKIDVMVERVTDSIEGIEIVRSYNLYNVFVSHIKESIDDILANEYVRAWIMHFSQTVNRLLFWIPNMICPCLAMYMVIRGDMTIGGMTAYIVLMHKIMGEIKMLPFMLNEFRERRISIERVESVLSSPCEDAESKAKAEKCTEGCTEEYAVEFNGVSFAYADNAKLALDNMTFRISKGQTVAVVGESGHGKSTIFKLLCGFYEKKCGEIKVNGKPLDNIGIGKLRKQIAVVEQQAFLFEGTIWENIAVGGSDVTKQQVIDAAKLAGIHEFIVSLPKGYDTVIGEKGAGLSGGEKQRIAIARALVKDAPILLLDEPTASVDVATDEIIQETIKRLNGRKTVMIIAHRLATIKDVENIMVVNEGQVSESGSHLELISRDGIYKRLYEYEKKGGGVNA
ncbi:MAG: ABC transporter ATP-binding protein [Lachnospira sp.]|nr:ABC transporter ATP-binding protein [Lachnospira sp.]